MRYKKFLLVPLLLFIYIFFIVDMLVSFNPTSFGPTTPTASSGAAPGEIGVGDSVSVVVTRPYFFKLIRLPIYTSYIGYIGGYHQAFFYFVGILTVVFVILEFFVELDWGKTGKTENTGREKFEWRDRQMKVGKGKNIDLVGLAKTFGLGVLFGLIVYIISLDGGVATGLGLLVMYLEHKLK